MADNYLGQVMKPCSAESFPGPKKFAIPFCTGATSFSPWEIDPRKYQLPARKMCP